MATSVQAFRKRQNIRFRKSQRQLSEKITLSSKAISEIQWWISNIDNFYHNINIPNSDIITQTDPSLTDWRITDGIYLSRG